MGDLESDLSFLTDCGELESSLFPAGDLKLKLSILFAEFDLGELDLEWDLSFFSSSLVGTFLGGETDLDVDLDFDLDFFSSEFLNFDLELFFVTEDDLDLLLPLPRDLESDFFLELDLEPLEELEEDLDELRDLFFLVLPRDLFDLELTERDLDLFDLDREELDLESELDLK